jgi:uncharacterized membrane protein
MNTQRKQQVFHLLFYLSVIGKGFDGVLEIVGGVLLIFISPHRIYSVMRFLTQHELSEDPNDLIANYLLNIAQHLTKNVTLFAAAYLLWHGAVKVGLVAALLLKRRWAYPAAIVAFSLFLIYQLYRYSHTRSTGLLALSIADVVVIILTWIEYRRLQAIHGFAGATE